MKIIKVFIANNVLCKLNLLMIFNKKKEKKMRRE
jgi:hypothetical protein